MRVRQTVVTTPSDACLKHMAEIKPNLVLAFASPGFFNDPDFATWLGRAFPQAQRVGLSTAGEIPSHGVSEHSAVITAIHFDHIPFKVAATKIIWMERSLTAPSSHTAVQTSLVYGGSAD